MYVCIHVHFCLSLSQPPPPTNPNPNSRTHTYITYIYCRYLLVAYGAHVTAGLLRGKLETLASYFTRAFDDLNQ